MRWLSVLLLAGCSAHPQVQLPVEGRVERRAIVKMVGWKGDAYWWIEEKLASWNDGDRDPGMRRLVRLGASGVAEVVWEAPAEDRMTDAVIHPSGAWTVAGVDAVGRPFVVRGQRRDTLDDPALADDKNAWWGEEAPTQLEVSALSADSIRLAADGEDVVVVLMNRYNAVLAYRQNWSGDGWRPGPRTLVTPAMLITPYLPIGGSYDNFDAMVNWFLVSISIDQRGRCYVAHWVNPARLAKHNQVFATDLSPLRTNNDRPSDILVTRIDRDGSRVFSRVVGTADVDDEIYSVSAADDRVAVVGRNRLNPGLDNTEWHVFAAVVDENGGLVASLNADVLESGIGQSAAWVNGELFIGGSEGWKQNPDGFSLSQPGRPLLLLLRGGALETASHLLPPTSGHSELRALGVAGDHLWIGGMENGPLTHTGDADPTAIRADGFWSSPPTPSR